VCGGGPNLWRPSWASPSASPIHPQVTPNCQPPSFQTLAVASLGALGHGGSSSTPPRLLLHPRRDGSIPDAELHICLSAGGGYHSPASHLLELEGSASSLTAHRHLRPRGLRVGAPRL
ncbi:hypothetical protein ZEAMMB73_Zm00001d005952, partial [Zea mays]